MKRLPFDSYVVDVAKGADQVDRVCSIFSNNNNHKTRQHIAWQYSNAPGGGAYTGFSVSKEGEDAAVYSVFKVKAKIGDRIQVVCQSLDTLTDARHRGRGLFPILAREVYAKCDEDGVGFVYGFPNSSSAPGFFKRLGWEKIGFPPFIFYLNNLLFPVSYLIKKKLFLKNYPALFLLWAKLAVVSSGMQITRSVDFLSEEYGGLWQKFSEKLSVCIWRDGDYMNWRYKLKPNREYCYLSVHKDGALAGILVYLLANKHDGKIGYIMDVIYDPDLPGMGSLLVSQAILDMSKQGVDVVLAWSAPSFQGYAAYAQSLFFKMPRKLQPIKLFFGYRPGVSLGDLRISFSDFYISYADSDTV